MLPMLTGIVPFGVVCGVGALSAGVSPLATLAMSLIIFSGAAQIAATQMLADGAPFAVIVLTCFVLSLRFLMYSAAMAPHLRSLDSRWRNLLAFLLTDQAFASTIQRFRESGDLRANASYFLGAGMLLWVAWGASTLAGVLLGIRDSVVVAARVCCAVGLHRHSRAVAAGQGRRSSCSWSRQSRSLRSTRCRCVWH